MLDSVLVNQENRILTITLNRPEVRNALNPEMMERIVSVLDAAQTDPGVRVVVFKAAGTKAFSAGGDLRQILEKRDEGIVRLRSFLEGYANLILALHRVGKPTVAAVRGYALAGGCGLAVACDLTLADETAVFGIPEINIGYWGMIISAPVVRLIGLKRALELMYTGRQVSPAEAERIGLINRVVPASELDAAVDGLAASLAKANPVAVRLGREGVLNAADLDYEPAIKYLREMVTILAATEDTAEGLRAFLEKRPPSWSL